MPYRTIWEPAPKDMSLHVLSELPDGYSTGNYSLLSMIGIREARKGFTENMYFCDRCNGWIKGYPNEYKVDNLGLLSGRHGTEYYCLRCGHEMGFMGVMS